jgi:hypothetical protein
MKAPVAATPAAALVPGKAPVPLAEAEAAQTLLMNPLTRQSAPLLMQTQPNDFAF